MIIKSIYFFKDSFIWMLNSIKNLFNYVKNYLIDKFKFLCKLRLENNIKF